MRYTFEWDPTKARHNLRTHHVSFERATTVFRDPYMLSVFDADHSDIEERWNTLGRDESGILLVVSHTFREDSPSLWTMRIISARKASKKERRQYEEKPL